MFFVTYHSYVPRASVIALRVVVFLMFNPALPRGGHVTLAVVTASQRNGFHYVWEHS